MNIHLRRTAATISAAVMSAAWCAPSAADAVHSIGFALSPAQHTGVSLSTKASVSLALPHIADTKALSDGELTFSAGYGTVKSTQVSENGFPASFDMREAGTISAVRDQGHFGTCWAHSSAASAESSVIGAYPAVDLAELYTAYFPYYGEYAVPNGGLTSFDDILDYGGNVYTVASLWAQWSGPVFESALPYADYLSLNDTALVDALNGTSDFHLENAYFFDFDHDRTNADEINALIKQFVYSGQAVDVSFFSNTSETYSYAYYSSNTKKHPVYADHAVTIAGWDDDFPADKFKVRPEHDGAWLVKNSWGIDFAEDGYFWISYDNASLCDLSVFELGDKNNYAEIFQHDNFSPAQAISADDYGTAGTPSYMANVFTPDETMQIEAVSTYILDPATSYEITLYTDIKDPADPTSGTASQVTSGKADMTGYITFELDSNVVVNAGESFGVVMKLSNEETPFVIPVESTTIVTAPETEELLGSVGAFASYDQIQGLTGTGESFFSADGEKWYDVNDGDYRYTEDEELQIIESLRSQLLDGVEPDDSDRIAAVESVIDSYSKLFASGDVTAVMGNVTLKAFGNPVNTVDFSHISGEVHSDERVALSTKDGSDIYYSVNGSEYALYTEPLAVTEKCTVSATTDYLTFTRRDYTPALAEFNAISYRMYSNEVDSEGQHIMDRAVYFGTAVRISASEFRIEVPPEYYGVDIYPATTADVKMNGEPIETYKFSSHIPTDYGETVITFELSNGRDPDNTVTLTIVHSAASIDVSSETVYFSSSVSAVYAPDGTELSDGDSVSSYAGQTLTVIADGEETALKVPERAKMPEPEIDYYTETLGFFPNETALRLRLAAGESPADDDFVYPEYRFVDGDRINSGMVMNKALRVIPGETLTLKILAGNGEFASEPLTVKIPDAPEAPADTSVLTRTDSGLALTDYDYEACVPTVGATLDTYTSKYAYSSFEKFSGIALARFGTDDTALAAALLEGAWSCPAVIPYGRTYALRYAATDTAFASKPLIVDLEGAGDVNGDGLIDSADASLILVHNANSTAGEPSPIAEEYLHRADFNGDGMTDPVDGSLILIYNADSTADQPA